MQFYCLLCFGVLFTGAYVFSANLVKGESALLLLWCFSSLNILHVLKSILPEINTVPPAFFFY